MIPIQQQSTSQDSSPSIFVEAQQAMASDLASNTEWATPDLLQTLAKHPKLAAGMSNPKFTAALKQMQSNPKETLKKVQQDEPETLELINEFCSVVGEHFCRLGEEQEKMTGSAKNNGSASMADEKVREMGVLEKEAMMKHKSAMNQETKDRSSQRNTTVAGNDTSQNAAASDEQVASILSNDELRSVLLDTKMQQIMQECSTQCGKLQYYMRHEEYGPKLRRLIEVGLLRVS
jgi:hypothetical protein